MPSLSFFAGLKGEVQAVNAALSIRHSNEAASGPENLNLGRVFFVAPSGPPVDLRDDDPQLDRADVGAVGGGPADGLDVGRAREAALVGLQAVADAGVEDGAGRTRQARLGRAAVVGEGAERGVDPEQVRAGRVLRRGDARRRRLDQAEAELEGAGDRVVPQSGDALTQVGARRRRVVGDDRAREDDGVVGGAGAVLIGDAVQAAADAAGGVAGDRRVLDPHRHVEVVAELDPAPDGPGRVPGDGRVAQREVAVARAEDVETGAVVARPRWR